MKKNSENKNSFNVELLRKTKKENILKRSFLIFNNSSIFIYKVILM